jgi:hypothetical protein
VAERLVASQEGFSSVELFMFLKNGGNLLPDYMVL